MMDELEIKFSEYRTHMAVLAVENPLASLFLWCFSEE